MLTDCTALSASHQLSTLLIVVTLLLLLGTGCVPGLTSNGRRRVVHREATLTDTPSRLC